MEIVMQGVIHGQTVELERSPGLDDGSVVQVVLNVERPSPAARSGGAGPPATAAGMMANYTEDDDAVLEEIHRDRGRDTRREIEP
jgi:hypothetical protein